MTAKHVGGTIVVLGVVIQVAEGIAQADAVLAGVPYAQTSIGAVLDPIESHLPISLGWTLIVLGGAVFAYGVWRK